MDNLKHRKELMDTIEKVAKAEGLKNHRICEPVETNPKGEGFLGEIFFVTLTDEGDNGDSISKQLSLAVKAAFKDEQIRQAAPIRVSFENEVLFYSTIYPAFRKFERDRGVEDTADLIPRCFDASLQNGSEIVVLENLKPLGFEVFDKADLLDHDHVKLICEAYGRYHAYSFAFKDQHPEEFEEFVSRTNDVWSSLVDNQIYLRMFMGLVELTKTFFAPGEDDEILRRLKKYEGVKVGEVFRESVTVDCDCSILVQGDCWSNNMMFKYERNGDQKKLKDIRLLDWQLIKLGSPACDLSYFLYTGASKDIYDRLDYYLHIYHDALSFHVRRLGSDPEEVFPFGALKRHWALYSKFGFIMALSMLKMKLTKKGELVDFTDVGDLTDEEFNERLFNVPYDKELYRERIVDLFRHMLDIDAL